MPALDSDSAEKRRAVSSHVGQQLGAFEMDHPEIVAQAVVEALETGSRVQHQAKQSHGEHDFDLVYRDGRIAALEVTAAADEHSERTAAALRDKRKGGPFVPTRLCKHDWYVHPGRNAIINRIRTQADKYLAQIEADGLMAFFSSSHAAEYDSVRRIWNDLGVLGGSVVKWKKPGQICISGSSGGGAVGISAFTEAIRGEADKPDNRRKLGAANTEERHLFVYVHPRNYLPWRAFVIFDPPSEPIALPPEVTDVWAATEGESFNEFIVWRTRRGEPWCNCGPLTLVLTSSAAPRK
jgi:hypothetical protein